MKKIYLSLIAVLSVCQFTYAQWNPGTGIITTTNNVGIGTTTPAMPLDVSGSANVGNVNNRFYLRISSSLFPELRFQTPTDNEVIRLGVCVGVQPFPTNDGDFYIYTANTGTMPLIVKKNGNVNLVPTSGVVSIGTTNPTTGILVAQGIITSQTSTTLSTGNNDAFNLYAGGGGYASGARQSILWSQSGLTLGRFGTEYNGPRAQIDFIWRDLYNNGASSIESMRLTGSGNLGIGTSTPDQKLTVKGTIHSLAVIVDNNITPDYVFKPTYKLVSLKEVKAYIEKNHHLEEIPSAKTVSKLGLNLGDMNTLLLKKVEELTLYAIASDKEIKDEKSIIIQQQALLLQFQKQLNNQQKAIYLLKHIK